MALQQRHGEPAQPAQVVAEGAFAGATVVFAEGHVEHPVHRLDAPVAPHRLAESFAAQVAGGDVVADFAGLAAVAVGGQAEGVADGFDFVPVRGRGEVAGDFGEEVGAFVGAAVAFIAGFVGAVFEVFEVASDGVVEVGFDGGVELGLVAFDGDDAVAATFDDRSGETRAAGDFTQSNRNPSS